MGITWAGDTEFLVREYVEHVDMLPAKSTTKTPSALEKAILVLSLDQVHESAFPNLQHCIAGLHDVVN